MIPPAGRDTDEEPGSQPPQSQFDHERWCHRDRHQADQCDADDSREDKEQLKHGMDYTAVSRPRDPDQALDLDRGNSKILDFLDSSFGNTRPVRTVSKIWSNTTPG